MQYLKGKNIAYFLSRILTALVTVMLFYLITTDSPFSSPEFNLRIKFSVFITCTVTQFILLCFVSSQRVVNILLISLTTLYFSIAAFRGGSYYFSFGLALVLCMGVYYFDVGNISIRLQKHRLWALCCFLMLLFALWVGTITCMYYWNNATSCYDMGIFSQMFHSMKQTGTQLTTCERDKLLSHFAVHFSPIYYVLLPVYCLFPTPATLLVSQAVLVAGGVIPLILICRRYRLTNAAALAFAFCYLLYPGFLGGCFYHFHENCFLPALLLWFFYFSEKESAVLSLIFAILIMLVKEDAPMYVAVISLYLIIANKNRVASILTLVFSVVWFITITKLMSIYGEGVMTDSRFSIYIHDGGGLLSFVKSVIQNPIFAIEQIFTPEKLLFVLQLFVPLCFFPVLIKKPARLILFIPLLLVNLLTNYHYQHEIGYQYVFGPGALIFYLAVINYADLGPKRSRALLCAVLCSLVIFCGGHMKQQNYSVTYRITEDQRQTVQQAITVIPDDASVVAATYFVPLLSQREEIYELETTKQTAQYYVLDLRGHGYPEVQERLLSGDYVCLVYEEGVIAIFLDPNY